MNLYELHAGDSPLLIDVPHAGTFLPPKIAARLAPVARTAPDTDWHVEKVYAFARAAGATLMAATHSRIVVDLNRDPSGAALYPGPTIRSCARRAPSPTIRSTARPARPGERRSPRGAPGTSIRITPCWNARSSAFAPGTATWSCSTAIRFAPRCRGSSRAGCRISTWDRGRHELRFRRGGRRRRDTRVRGRLHARRQRPVQSGYVTRRYGQPERGVHTMQLEMAQCAYMDEAPPYRWDAQRAAPLGTVLVRLVDALAAWRPE